MSVLHQRCGKHKLDLTVLFLKKEKKTKTKKSTFLILTTFQII